MFHSVREGTFPPGFRDHMTKVHAVVRALTAIRCQRRPSAAEIKRDQLVELKKLNKKARKAYVPVL